MKERLTIFGVGFIVSCVGIMFFLHFRKLRSGESGIIKGMINAAGEVGNIEEWIEADTFVVKLPRETVTVHLNAVDTPPLGMPGGNESLQFLKDLVGQDPVRVLEFRRTDQGDIVGEVYTQANLSLNEELMKAGWAWFYEPDSTRNPYYQELNDAAIKERKGLWSLGEPVPPWKTIPRNTAP
ncbi:MAG: thermonuclease family protein [Verrucomicrobiae bacterium]|nr:thermonuclease family protein [Verrucomicrobiae bacterium]